MVQDNPVTPVIYTVPKIHEDLLRPPGRPIVPVNGSLTEPHSSMWTLALPSHLKNTSDFLKKLKDLFHVLWTCPACTQFTSHK